MPVISFYLDPRKADDMEWPLKMCITHDKERAYISLPIKLRPSQWDKDSERVVRHEQAGGLTRSVMRARLDAEDAIEEYSKNNDVSKFRALHFRLVVLGEDPAELIKEKTLFYTRYVSFMDRKTGGTLALYKGTLKKLEAFDSRIKHRTFEDLNRSWLLRFEAFLATTSPSANARSIHFRNIRAVFNDAIDDDVTNVYPFRRFKIKTTPTRKRSLTAEQLRRFFDAPCADFERKYLDMFKLMFLLIGINSVDLANLKKADYINGRIEYVRAKTHGLYSIAVPEEADEIIRKYAGAGKYLLNIMGTMSSYKNFSAKMNKALGEIGGTRYAGQGGKKYVSPMFPQITTYWARHSWATIAASLDIPKETIAHALGHRSVYSTITDIYIDFDMRKVDEANRRVIDYVLYNNKV